MTDTESAQDTDPVAAARRAGGVAGWRTRVTDGLPVLPLFLITGVGFVHTSEHAIFQVVAPQVQETFQLSLAEMGALAALAPLMATVEQILGYFADRHQRRRILIGAVFVTAAFTALLGVAGLVTSVALLYVARLGSSLGSCSNAVQLSMLCDYYPAAGRAKTFMFAQIGAQTGPLVAPIGAGALAVSFGWPTPFLVMSLPVFALAFALRTLTEPRRGQFELTGSDLAFRADFGVAHSIKTIGERRSARWLYLSRLFAFIAPMTVGSYITIYFSQVYQVSSLNIGFIVAAVVPAQYAALLIGGGLLQKAMPRRPKRGLILLSTITVAQVGALVALPFSSTLAAAVAAYAVFSAVTVLIDPGGKIVLSLVLRPDVRAFGLAAAGTAAMAGMLLLPLAGYVGDTFGVRAPLLVFAPLTLLAAPAYLMASRTIDNDLRTNDTAPKGNRPR